MYILFISNFTIIEEKKGEAKWNDRSEQMPEVQYRAKDNQNANGCGEVVQIWKEFLIHQGVQLYKINMEKRNQILKVKVTRKHILKGK